MVRQLTLKKVGPTTLKMKNPNFCRREYREGVGFNPSKAFIKPVLQKVTLFLKLGV